MVFHKLISFDKFHLQSLKYNDFEYNFLHNITFVYLFCFMKNNAQIIQFLSFSVILTYLLSHLIAIEVDNFIISH